MDAFFRDSKEIQEWIDLIIEKLLTVSLLDGHETDSDFYEGRQAVEKIASFLKQIPQLPEENIKDGIQQLVEQRLPDQRVIDDLPAFYELMNDMIKDALRQDLPSSIPCSIVSLSGGGQLRVQNSENNNCVSLNKYRLGMGKDDAIQGKEGLSGTLVTEDVIHTQEIEEILDEVVSEKKIEKVEKVEEIEEIEEAKEIEEVMAKIVVAEEIEEEVIDEIVVIETKELVPEEKVIELESNAENKGTTYDGQQQDSEEKVVECQEEKLDEETAGEETRVDTAVKETVDKAVEKEEDLVQEIEATEAVSMVNLGECQGTKSPFSTSVKISPSPKPVSPYNKIVRNVRIPTDGGRLARVLTEMFPQASVKWDFNLGSYRFYAQVDKLLIYVIDNEELLTESEINSLKKNFKRQGWYVYICSKEDLAYPRRLERGIKLSIPKKRT